MSTASGQRDCVERIQRVGLVSVVFVPAGCFRAFEGLVLHDTDLSDCTKKWSV